VTLRDQAPGELVFQRFGFSDFLRRISENRLDQLQDAYGRTAICFDPPTQILAKLWLENRFALIFPAQDLSPAVTVPRRMVCLSAADFVRAQPADAWH
jgi:hypothetical protein